MVERDAELLAAVLPLAACSLSLPIVVEVMVLLVEVVVMLVLLVDYRVLHSIHM